MLSEALKNCGLIAILRGVAPDIAMELAQELYGIGFRVIEIPINSPEPMSTIANLRKVLPADCVVGAGTVYLPEQVDEIRNAGGSLIVMPHSDPKVIAAARAAQMEIIPGVATPNEAFAAFTSGVNHLKVFPADQLGSATLKAWISVLPHTIRLIPVGGITLNNLARFVAAGAVALEPVINFVPLFCFG